MRPQAKVLILHSCSISSDLKQFLRFKFKPWQLLGITFQLSLKKIKELLAPKQKGDHSTLLSNVCSAMDRWQCFWFSLKMFYEELAFNSDTIFKSVLEISSSVLLKKKYKNNNMDILSSCSGVSCCLCWASNLRNSPSSCWWTPSMKASSWGKGSSAQPRAPPGPSPSSWPVTMSSCPPGCCSFAPPAGRTRPSPSCSQVKGGGLSRQRCF